MEFAGNLASATAQAAAAAAVNSSFNLMEAWAQDRLTMALLQAALSEVQAAASDTIYEAFAPIRAAGQFIQDVLNGAWKSEAYREQLFRNISSTVVNSAFGMIMGAGGGFLMTVAAPQMLMTQVAFNGINLLYAWDYYRKTGDSRLLLIRALRTGVNLGLTLMQWRLNLSPSCNCLGHCFPAGTLVSTEHGQRHIETVRAGERVWAMDLRDGQWKLRRVLETFNHTNDEDLLSIKVGGETIQVTPGHPFWVVKGEGLEKRLWPDEHVEREADGLAGRWVGARELRVGDILLSKPGETAAVEQIVVGEGGDLVYNLQVDELANYAVGVGSFLVHNNGNSAGTGGSDYFGYGYTVTPPVIPPQPARRSPPPQSPPPVDPTKKMKDLIPGSSKRELPGEHENLCLNDIEKMLKTAKGEERKKLLKTKKLAEQQRRLQQKPKGGRGGRGGRGR